MYKRHKRQLSICVMATTAMAFMFDWDFTPIAEIAVTVASIAGGIYCSSLCFVGKPIFKRFEKYDRQRTTKQDIVGRFS